MKSVINIKADKDVKEKAMAIAAEIGVSLSTIINALLHKFIREKQVTLTASYKPSKKLEKILRKADKDIKSGKNLSKIYTDADGFIADLRS